MFFSTVFRFRYKSVTLVWQFFSLTYAITTAASYHADSRQWEFTVFWFAYSGIGGAVAYLCATFVLPVTAGALPAGGAAGRGPGAAAGPGRERWAARLHSQAGASCHACSLPGERFRDPAYEGPAAQQQHPPPHHHPTHTHTHTQAPSCGAAWPLAWSSPLTP